ncbi:MAG: DUF3179 domain-containing protein [Gammaproteobacteria bacterium]|nr:DUF3179 domain-containing protein [Gammaproteobacteria bacterium]MBQ0840305.1 DUF3179 domain-containing protein [Gammaproteobacteria bacterium]
MAWVGAVAAETKNGFDVSASLVPVAQILRGGPPRDGIPAIDKPVFMPATEADLAGNERVMGVFFKGIARAYPIRMLNRHEVVNDTFGATAVVVSYCPLCGSGVVFLLPSAQAASTFGVSGLLYNSDVLLYDRESESLWSQLMLQAISGLRRGERLTLVTATHTSWGEWQQRYPETLLLSTASAPGMSYSQNPYAGYESSEQLWFPVAHKSDALGAKERVLGLSINGVDKAYPYSELANSQGVFEDIVAGKKVEIVWSQAAQSAYVLDAEGQQLPSVSAYWFAWFGFHPQTLIYRVKNQ